MPLGLNVPAVPSPRPFRDGFGERAVIVAAATGDVVEALRLDAALAAGDAFEAAVRERMDRLSHFDDDRFTQPIRLERGPLPGRGLALVSRRPAGSRLSELLDGAVRAGESFGAVALSTVAATLSGAVAALHRISKDVAVGTLAAERVLVTADSRVLVTEHVFGTAFEGLNLTREPLWRSYRIATPSLAGRLRLDRRTDLVQIGLVLLAMTAGRPIRDDEFPASLPALVARTTGPPDLDEMRQAALRAWLLRALQLDARRSFQSAGELEHGLADWVPSELLPATTDDRQTGGDARAPQPPAIPSHPAPPVVVLPEPEEPMLAPVVDPMAVPTAVPTAGPTRGDGWTDPVLAQELRAAGWVSDSRRVSRPASWRRPAQAVAITLVIAATVLLGALGARAAWQWAMRPAGSGTLVVESRPQGAAVRIDDADVGQTPVASEVHAGGHTVELQLGQRRRVIPVTLADRERLTLSFEMRDVRDMGQIEVRSDPPGAEVSIDGRPHGRAPLLVDVGAGAHVVRVSGATTVQHQLTVQPGRTALLLVSLDSARPSATPPSSTTRSPSSGPRAKRGAR